MNTLRLLLIIPLLWLAGCAGPAGKSAALSESKTLSASGISRFDDSGALNVKQRWQQAQQNAKLDAYRDLAAQLYREPLPNGSTVGAQVMRDEAYRIYVDSYLREARPADYRTVRDHLKATLDLTLTPRFYRCMAGDAGQVGQCKQQDQKLAFSRLGYREATVVSANLACGNRDCSDQYHVKGFSKQPNVVDDVLLDAGMYDSEWTINTGARTLLNYFLTNGFLNAL